VTPFKLSELGLFLNPTLIQIGQVYYLYLNYDHLSGHRGPHAFSLSLVIRIFGLADGLDEFLSIISYLGGLSNPGKLFLRIPYNSLQKQRLCFPVPNDLPSMISY